MKKVLLVGGVGAGKSTVRQRLLAEPIEYAKTQALELFGQVVDSPGEYWEGGRFWHALQTTSCDVDVVALLLDPTTTARIPAGFASCLSCPVIGVVTKSALATPRQLETARARLSQEGIDSVLVVDSVSGEGFESVREVLCLE